MRLREVGGLELQNVPHTERAKAPELPLYVPLIYHRSGLQKNIVANTVALSLYQLLDKRVGRVRICSRAEVNERFRLDSDTRIILSGTEKDQLLERWWRLPQPESVLASLKELGIALITSPNYSVFSDVPRLDNLHNMKRIAIAWSEIQSSGIPCAIHLNARTERDWERWSEFLEEYEEVESVAFEFGTGAGSGNRIDWHVNQLCGLARRIDRPLRLIVRGGTTRIGELSGAFGATTVIDSSAFVRSQKRRRAVVEHGQLRWDPALTAPGEPLDVLLKQNMDTVHEFISEACGSRAPR